MVERAALSQDIYRGAAMIKPTKIAQLKKEKAIGAIEGWTDTINWTTQSVAALKGKKD